MTLEHDHLIHSAENPLTIQGFDIAARSGAILSGMVEYHASNSFSLWSLTCAVLAGAFCGVAVYSAGADIPEVFRQEYRELFRRNRHDYHISSSS